MSRRLPKGWREGTVRELLGLSHEDAELVEIRVQLARELSSRRRAQGLNQTELAERVGSSQARISRAERSDASIEMLIRSLLALGATRRDIARAISS